MNAAPVVRDVVLVGGGHSHVIFIRMWAMQPIPGVRLTLISEKSDTPYSGMLPGLIAGHYSEADVHIDLVRLCSWAGVRFIAQRVSDINLDAKTVGLSDNIHTDSECNDHVHRAETNIRSTRPSIGFDLLSLDTGSTPELNVAGAAQFSVPVKPVHGFYQRWLSILKRVQARTNTAKAISIGVVGSGAGGFELIMAMRHALDSDVADCHWIIRGERVIKDRPEKVSAKALQAAKNAGVVIHDSFDVVDVKDHSIQSRDGRIVSLDETVWCAAAKAPQWPQEAGLRVDERGFVLTNAHLQSVDCDFVFATGDIGTQQDTPSDKAGVFAVRQAPILFQNIRRYLLGAKLKVYRPQSDFLSLMATGEKSAIGNRAFITVQGAWVWLVKNAIDQKFMNQFRQLPAMKARHALFKVPQALLKHSTVSEDEASGAVMRCRGCGGKVGASILDSVLAELQSPELTNVISGFHDAADAAIIQTDSRQLVQSVDQLSTMCDDPYVFGRIAAVHALSDVVASGATPHSAQVIVSLPFADQRIVKRDLQQVMAGVIDALNDDHCSLIGGHTSEDATLSLGLVINGFLDAEPAVKATKINAGDHLVLTKPVGSGVLLAGMMRQRAAGADIQSVLSYMQKSNRMAASVLYKNGVVAATDVTGFGLLGHLNNLLAHSGLGATLKMNNIPLFNGALALAEVGIGSTLLEQNQGVLSLTRNSESVPDSWLNLLCDPQTSGGLLGIVPATQSDKVMTALRANGCDSACIIGTLVDQAGIALSA